MWLTVTITGHLCLLAAWLADSLREEQNSYNNPLIVKTISCLKFWKLILLIKASTYRKILCHKYKLSMKICCLGIWNSCWKCVGSNNLHRYLLHMSNLRREILLMGKAWEFHSRYNELWDQYLPPLGMSCLLMTGLTEMSNLRVWDGNTQVVIFPPEQINGKIAI